ncbi:uncharacterized protein LOC121371061 isoform X2 [Gigantopelta aegis]|uniref:uncharacterized protein LOC121371061 isoform X2 n=1 Tax=Gigantopelta aegis TaxID=1735272 RepID=UPI001B88E35C|nr:uncharacterized protein LOC121371061 isoform X2 [Gigantopelta aegis]
MTSEVIEDTATDSLQDSQMGPLQRRPAFRRKGYAWTSKTLTQHSGKSARTNVSFNEDASEENDEHNSSGSSLDLAPSLLTIYDSIAAGNSPPDTGLAKTDGKSKSKSLPGSASAREMKSSVFKVYNKERPKTMIDPTGDKDDDVDTADTKKRPLSISSSSSASSSSLTRHQRKRPNLTICDEHHKSNGNAVDCGSNSHGDVNGNSKIGDMEYETSPSGCDTSPMETNVATESSLGSANGSPTGSGDTSVLPGGKKVTKCAKRSHNGSASPPASPSTDVDSISTSKKMGNLNSVSEIKNKASTLPSVSRQKSSEGMPSSNNKTTSSSNHVLPSSPTSPKSSSTARDASSTSSSGGSKPHYVSYVQRVVSEIIDSERIYVKSLEDIIQGYLEYLENNSKVKVTDKDLKCLFSNIRQIYEFGRLFLWELEQCDREPVRVAECFVRNNEGFVIYTDYCTNYPSAVEVLTRFMADPNMSEVFKNRQFILGHGLPLGAYLLKPVQRILKYHLLLQNILKFFEKEKPGYSILDQAFKHMTQMAHHINEMKRKHEHAVRIQEIQSQLEDYAGKDLTCLGELVLEGSFRVYGAKASRQVFLFEKDILISKKKEGGMLGCKAQVQMANLMLVEVIPNEPLSFHIIPFDNPRAQYTLQARNMEQKRRWCQEIKRLILETYKGKIPDNVKDLVMELGRNHDDDYVNSENHDPRRQHHTAPEYLEKRRIRRKSGSKMPDFSLLKPQKAKKAPRKQEDKSPSPLRQRRSAPSLLKSEPSPDKSKGHLQRATSNDSSKNSKETTHRNLSPVQQSPQMKAKSETYQSHASADDINIRPVKTHTDQAAVAENIRRAKSFRKATRMRPVNSQDLSDWPILSKSPNGTGGSDSESDVDDPNLTKDGLKEYSDYVFGSRSDLSDDERIDTQAEAEIDQYCSLPVLPHQRVVLPSPEIHFDTVRSQESKSNENILPKPQSSSPHSWKKNKSKSTDSDVTNLIEKRLSNSSMNPDNKKVNAFNDSFSRKSQQSLVSRALRMPLVSSHLSLDGEKVLKEGSKAKLTNWSSTEKLTKGSMNDVSYLSEDPWVKNVEDTDVKVSKESVNMNNISRPRNSSDASELRPRENIDWMVYVNRNSLNENPEQLRFFAKHWTLPRVPMSPPVVENNKRRSVTPPSSPSRIKSHDVFVKTVGPAEAGPTEHDVVLNLSPISQTSGVLLVPSIVVSNSSLPSSPKHYHHHNHHHHHFHRHGKPYLLRSNSTPMSKSRIDALNMFDKNRPASLDYDVLDSDKMVAEMEDYMKNSSSESSFANKFPKDLPTLNYDDIAKSKRLSCASSVSTSSYDSHSSSSTEGLMDTLKHKIHNWTSRIAKRMEDSDLNSGTSSVSDVRPSSLVMTDDEKWDDDKAKCPSEEKGVTRLQKQLQEDAELQTFLRQRGLGGGSIGSRMAHTVPTSGEETLLSQKNRPHNACLLRGDNDSLSSYELSSKESTPEPQSRFSLPASTSAVESFLPLSVMAASSDVQQSDSGFSMQSDVTDSFSTENIAGSSKETLMDKEKQISNCESKETSKDQSDGRISRLKKKQDNSPKEKRRNRTHSGSSADSVDSFYERRLSVAFESEVFHNLPPVGDQQLTTAMPSPRKPITSIRDFVQLLEERSKPKLPQTVEVKKRQPGCMIKQRLQNLQEASQYKRGSRPTSEERELMPPKSIKDMQAALVHEAKTLKQAPSFGTLHCGTLNPNPASSQVSHVVSVAANSHVPCSVAASSCLNASSSTNTTAHQFNTAPVHSHSMARIHSYPSTTINSAHPTLGIASVHPSLGVASTHPSLGVSTSLSGSNTSINSSCSSSVNLFGNQLMSSYQRAESEHGFDTPAMYSDLQPARSLGHLDQLSTEVENLVIMKGWVRSLISKFQNEG